jgi:hypothetical protein
MLENPLNNPFIDTSAWIQTLDDYRDRFAPLVKQEQEQQLT